MQANVMDIDEIKALCASHERQLHTIAESLKIQWDMLHSQVEFLDKVARQILSLSQEIDNLKSCRSRRRFLSNFLYPLFNSLALV